MKLKITKSIKKRVITLYLETVEFTSDEDRILNELGEPIIKFEKMYGTNAVQIAKKIRTGFKLRIKFDGSEDIEVTTVHCNDFIEEIKAKLVDTITLLQDEYETMNDIKAETTLEPISNITYSPQPVPIANSVRFNGANTY